MARTLCVTLIAVIAWAVWTTRSEARPTARAKLTARIGHLIQETQWRQGVMGVRLTPTAYRYRHRLSLGKVRADLRWWNRRAGYAWWLFTHPPHKKGWLCIHRFEGSWRDANDPYWGGLQMDRGFMSTYAPRVLLRLGYANRWTPLEQMWVAERAHRSGRGYGPWPNTARYCGLL
jgi:hypothetical protein